MINIYTDGACSNNPGRGGWAYAMYKEDNKEAFILDSGAEELTTNNRMELQAVVEALKRFGKLQGNKEPVTILSDSAYVVNCFKDDWISNWVKNDWMTSTKRPVINKDLWLELLEVMKSINVTFTHVKARSCDGNRKVDKMAKDKTKPVSLNISIEL